MLFRHYTRDFSYATIAGAINDYIQKEVPIIRKRFRYYNGLPNIRNKQTPDDRPNNQINTNYVKTVCDAYAGYLNLAEATSPVELISKNLTVVDDTVRDSLLSGVGYMLSFYSDSKPALAKLHPTQAMVFREPTIEGKIIGGATWNFYTLQEGSFTQEYVDIYVYDSTYVYTYSGKTIEGASLQSKQRHFFKYVPIIEVRSNAHYDGIADAIFDLQDAYDIALSSYTDGRESFSDSFLVISGMGFDNQTSQDLIDGNAKIINLPLQGADAKYLVKEDSAADVTSMLQHIEDSIWKVSGLSGMLSEDSRIGTNAAEALKLKLLPFINLVKTIESQIVDSLEYLNLALGNDKDAVTLEFTDAIDSINPQQLEDIANTQEEA